MGQFIKNRGRSLAESKCSRCSLVNTIPQCQHDNFRPDTFFNSGVVHLKRVPKNSWIRLSENLIPKTNDICNIGTKLDESNVEAGTRMAVGDDKIADFMVDNSLKLKHPQGGNLLCSGPQISRRFSSTSLSCPSPTGLVQGWIAFCPKILKDLTAKSNRQTGLNFLRALTNLVNVILDGNVPLELRPYFFGAS